MERVQRDDAREIKGPGARDLLGANELSACSRIHKVVKSSP